jgi:hypothetical protein
VWVPLEARLPAATGTGREDSDMNREVVFTRYPISQELKKASFIKSRTEGGI